MAQPHNGGQPSTSLTIQDRINGVKDNADLIAEIEKRLGQGQKSGNNLKWSCPFHADGKTPSLVTTMDQRSRYYGRYKCFGCGKTGDVIDLKRELDNMTLNQALQELGGVMDLSTLSSPEAQERLAQMQREMEEKRVQAEQARRDEETNAIAKIGAMVDRVNWYHSNLNKYPAGLGYWYSQGIPDEIIQARKLGYAPSCPLASDTPSYVIPYFESGQLVSIRHRLDHYNGGGKYRPEFAGLPLQLFNVDSLSVDDPMSMLNPGEMMIVEGEVKAIVLQHWLSCPVVGVPGISNWKPEWMNYFNTHQKIYIAFDPGEAAEQAAVKLGQELAKAGYKVIVVCLPAKPDDMLVRLGATITDFLGFLAQGRVLR